MGNAPDLSAPIAPPPTSISGVGAYTPNWGELIQGDAGLKDASAALAASGTNNLNALDAQIANAYEGFGKNVDLASLAKQLGMSQADIQNAIDPGAQKLAQENTAAGTSTVARLDAANNIANQKIIASLNARGMLRSGETGYALDQQNLSYRQAESDAYQKFLGYLQQYQQGYLTAQQKNSSDLAAAYSAAADRQYNAHPSTPGTSAQFDHVDSAGKPVYKDASGSYFNQDGSPYTAPNPAAPPATVVSPQGGSITLPGGFVAPAGWTPNGVLPSEDFALPADQQGVAPRLPAPRTGLLRAA